MGKKSKITKEEAKKIYELKQKGYKISYIVKKINRDRRTISKMKKKIL